MYIPTFRRKVPPPSSGDRIWLSWCWSDWEETNVSLYEKKNLEQDRSVRFMGDEKDGAYWANWSAFQNTALFRVSSEGRSVGQTRGYIVYGLHASAFCIIPNRGPLKGRSQATHTRPPSSSPLLTLYEGRFWNALPFVQYWPHSSPIPRNTIGQIFSKFPI